VLFLASAPGACSYGDGFSSATTTRKSGDATESADKTGKAEDTGDSADSDVAVVPPEDTGEDVQTEKTETAVTQDPEAGADDTGQNDETAEPPTAPVVIDKPEELENLGTAEIIVVQRLPDPASTHSFFYFAENDSLRPRGINIATSPAMDPNFTVYPKTVAGLTYHSAIENPGDARWNAYLAARHKAIRDFFRAIDARGLATFNASQCNQFENSNFVSSSPASAPPQNPQLAVFLTVPRNGVKITYKLRESGATGCGSLDQTRFETAVTHLLQRVENVVNAGHYWVGPDSVGMKLPPCPAEYGPVCNP
jgi:hypothetical protein